MIKRLPCKVCGRRDDNHLLDKRHALRISPDPDCRYCHGSGEVTDWVPYGDTDTAMTTTCDCILEQIPEGHEDDHIIIDTVRLLVRPAPEFEYDD